MGVYQRSGGAWTDVGVMRRRESGAWSENVDGGYVRSGGEWVQFQPVAAAELNPPENLAVAPDDQSAVATWTNPTQDVGNDPTHVQVRIPETTTVWTEIPMPVTTTTFSYLAPETEYQFQIRYVLREDGVVVKESPIAEKFFTTLALTGPGAPAADPGGSGPDTSWDWGVPSGGASCSWEYILQTAETPASGAIIWSDTAVTGTVASEGTLTLDLVNDYGIECGGLARFKYRENCSGALSDYEFGEPFMMVCDWDVTCGGLGPNAAFANTIYSDPNILFAFPEACADVDGLNIFDQSQIRIVDYTDNTIVYGKLSGFGAFDIYGEQQIIGSVDNGTLGRPTVAGQCGDLTLLVDADDLSISAWVQLDDVPGGSGGGSGTAPASFPFLRVGRNVAFSCVFATTTTFYIRATWIDRDGDFVTLTSSTAYNLDEFIHAALTLDSDGTKTLYVNAVVEATDTSNTPVSISGAGLGQDLEVYTNGLGRVKSVAGWDRVLTPEEVAAIYNPSAILASADLYFPMDEASGGVSFPYFDTIDGVKSMVLDAAIAAQAAAGNALDGDPITSFSELQAQVTGVGDDATFDGLGFAMQLGVLDSTYTNTGFDLHPMVFKDNTGNVTCRAFLDYTHPTGWDQGIQYYDSANTLHTLVFSSNFYWNKGDDNVTIPFVFGINAAGTEISYMTSEGGYQTVAVAGTGTIRCSGGIQTLDVGDTSSRSPKAAMGRFGIKLSAWTSVEMADVFYEYLGGVPAEFDFHYYGTKVTQGNRMTPFIIPSGITSVEVDVIGSTGRSATLSGSNTPGLGHRMTVSKSVTPGDIIYMAAGGHDSWDYWHENIAGEKTRVSKFLGGLTTGALASDRSQITSGVATTTGIEVIGAGGGGSYKGQGGNGGYPTGQDGSDSATGNPGRGGTQVAGGAAGSTGVAGSALAGGVGANGHGGDGWYGGGSESYGSSNNQAGGGGSSYIDGSSDWTLVSNGVYDPGMTGGVTAEIAHGRIRVRMT